MRQILGEHTPMSRSMSQVVRFVVLRNVDHENDHHEVVAFRSTARGSTMHCEQQTRPSHAFQPLSIDKQPQQVGITELLRITPCVWSLATFEHPTHPLTADSISLASTRSLTIPNNTPTALYNAHYDSSTSSSPNIVQQLRASTSTVSLPTPRALVCTMACTHTSGAYCILSMLLITHIGA